MILSGAVLCACRVIPLRTHCRCRVRYLLLLRVKMTDTHMLFAIAETQGTQQPVEPPMLKSLAHRFDLPSLVNALQLYGPGTREVHYPLSVDHPSSKRFSWKYRTPPDEVPTGSPII
jgi:hypothetical protein